MDRVVAALAALVTLLMSCPILAAQDGPALYREGLRLFAGRQPQPAIEALRKSVALQPSNAAAWKALGVVFASLGDLENAEPAFRNACERQPSLEDACLYYGRSLYLLDRFPAALDALHRALKTHESGEAHRLLALCLEALGRTGDADAEFHTALRLHPASAPDEDPGIDYGVFLYRQGRGNEALDPLRAVVDRHPDSARARLELGCVYLSLDRLDEAAVQLERSLALRDAERARQLLVKTYLRQGKPERAAPYMKK